MIPRIHLIAAAMADLNDCVLRYAPPTRTPRWPLWRLAVNLTGIAVALAAILAGLAL
jgi:hypothetical protein